MVEIDILNECKHPNILHLHEAYVFDKKIWVQFLHSLIAVPRCILNIVAVVLLMIS